MATDKLACLRAKAIKKGQTAPFPFMELKDFLPAWAEETRCSDAVLSPDEDEAKFDPYGGVAEPTTPRSKVRLVFRSSPRILRFRDALVRKTARKLDMVKWLSAYESFALAAHAAEA